MQNTYLIFAMIGVFMISACSKAAYPPDSTTSNHAHTYYVAVNGNDAAVGNINVPWKSINTALTKVAAGDTVIVRGGTYHEKINFARSGDSGKTIVLKAYDNERPVIDGSNIVVSGWTGLITMSNVQYITIEGFDVCNFVSSVKGADPEGIAVNGNTNHVIIKNCNIYNIKNTASLDNWRSAHAILVIGNGKSAITNLEITGCTVHDTQTGTSENITLAGNVDGFRVTHNKVYHTENIGIIIADGGGLNPSGDPAVNYARDGVVSDNELYNVSMANSVDIWGANNYGAIAIYVCGGSNTIVERNIVHDCDRGIGLVSESNAHPTNTTIVRNNFVYNNWRTGIYMGDYLNFTTAGTYDCAVVNNTLFQNDKVEGAFGEIEGEIRLTERCFSDTVCNNIIYARPTDVFIHKYTKTGANNMIDNNLYFSTGTPQWIWNSVSGNVINDFNDWKNASGCDMHTVYGKDPLLKSVTFPDLHIQEISPVRNAGMVISEAVNGSTDIDGNVRIVNNRISIGAQQ